MAQMRLVARLLLIKAIRAPNCPCCSIFQVHPDDGATRVFIRHGVLQSASVREHPRVRSRVPAQLCFGRQKPRLARVASKLGGCERASAIHQISETNDGA
jgi:hypothetical protein